MSPGAFLEQQRAPTDNIIIIIRCNMHDSVVSVTCQPDISKKKVCDELWAVSLDKDPKEWLN